LFSDVSVKAVLSL